jgi:hypothetical protein
MSSIFNTNMADYQDAKHKSNEVFFERMPEDKYEYKEHYVIIDSKDRDRTKFPNPNNYTIQFNNGTDGNIEEQFKNIVSIQLVDAIVPDAVTTDVPYLTLDIPELKSSYAGTNNHLSNTFALLLPESRGTPYARCKFVSPALNKYRTPISSLNKLTIQIKNSDGSFYSFGTDATPPTDPIVTLQSQLIFKFVTRDPDYKVLEPILT